jgi:uncharacterized membrane protein YkgB
VYHEQKVHMTSMSHTTLISKDIKFSQALPQRKVINFNQGSVDVRRMPYVETKKDIGSSSLIGFWTFLRNTDQMILQKMARYGALCLRVSLGIIYIWFGALKFFPHLSAAQDLAVRTMSTLTMGLVPVSILLFGLAMWECLIGIGLLVGRRLGLILMILIIHLLGTLTTFVIFPHEMFSQFPFAPSLVGQYVLKNIVLISATIVLGMKKNEENRV